MADTVTNTSQLSVQLISADGLKTKQLNIPNPLNSLGGRDGVIERLKPLVAEWEYMDMSKEPATAVNMVGVFGYYNDEGDWIPFNEFGVIQTTTKSVVKLS